MTRGHRREIMPHHPETQHSQTISKISDVERKGPAMQPQSGAAFITAITFACEAVIACARQLDIIDQECGEGNYGTALARGANAIKTEIKEGRISTTRPSATFTQMSRIVEKEVDGLEGGIYSLFFDIVAKNFRRFENDERLTANMWLIALTSANETVAEVSGISVGDRTLLDALVPVEIKLRDALDSGSNPVDAFAEAVNAAETSAMQTVNSNHKAFKHPAAGAHAVGIWMRAAYEGFKLKFNCNFNA
ncbi:putative 3,4-dihydroxy-2-butanone kinase [Pseudomyrmex gracilis]|uniref:putative 3,4-dihydroxy-2-butanone kinase n=1 Tax=Pseudomyrmex gracilis TaxID=219809 RepID=UPI0009950AA3|nr:putative 3,4-dihydroxy-2-butanone kinase [Pseudomyrmex gracilis]